MRPIATATIMARRELGRRGVSGAPFAVADAASLRPGADGDFFFRFLDDMIALLRELLKRCGPWMTSGPDGGGGALGSG